MEGQPKFNLTDKLLFGLVGILGSALILLLGKTWKIKIIGQEKVDEIRSQGKRVCYALWHGRLLALTYTHRNQGTRILISQHRDGEFISRIVERMGYSPARGSSTRGGVKAVLDMVKNSKNYDLAITPDGPRGPRHRVQAGAAYISSRSGLALIPISCSAHPAWILKSWDRFMIPKPFSRVVIMIANPITISPQVDEQELHRKSSLLEQTLVELTRQADNHFTQN
jgi:lysophospholipid acyltransferase (LPLAT)-like uncharacterized protein